MQIRFPKQRLWQVPPVSGSELLASPLHGFLLLILAFLFPILGQAQTAPLENFAGRINHAHVDGLQLHFNDPLIKFIWDKPDTQFAVWKYRILLEKSNGDDHEVLVIENPLPNDTTATMILSSPLIVGETYSVRINYKDVNGTWAGWVGGGAFTVGSGPDVTPPSLPTNFYGEIGGQNLDGLTIDQTVASIRFHWDHAEDASGIQKYRLIVTEVGDPYEPLDVIIDYHDGACWVPDTTFDMLPPLPYRDGKSYKIRLTVRDSTGNWTAPIFGGTFHVDLSGPPDTDPPGNVSGFVGTIGGQNVSGLTIATATPTIDFNWNAASDPSGIDYYTILLDRVNGSNVRTQQVNDPATSHTMTGLSLADNAQYEIRINATDNAGNPGSYVSGGIFTVDLGSPPDTDPPTAVTDFMGKINNQNVNGLTISELRPDIDLTWGEATDPSGIDNYFLKIRRVSPNPGNVDSRLIDGDLEAYQFTPNVDLQDGSVYRVQIKAIDGAGNSGPWRFSGNFTVDMSPPACADCWSNPNVWPGGVVPTSGTVTIPAGQTIQLDMDVTLTRLFINGKLRAKRDKDVDLTAKSIIVDGPNAELDWGTPTDRYLGRSRITLTGNNPNDVVGQMGAKVLGAMNGGILNLHGKPCKSWVRLAQNADKDNTQIVLSEDAGWEVGDSILLVSSRIQHTDVDQREITGISGGGTIIDLDAPLTYNHRAIYQTLSGNGQTWNVDMRAEVGLLTHNITVQGTPDANGLGGHVMMHLGGIGRADGIELYHMGQKAILGRYPWHWHRLKAAGAGQYIKNSAIRNSFNRAVTVHATDNVEVEGNFCYEHIGHGIFLEDGVEQYNTFRDNVVLHSIRPAQGEELTPSDNELVEIQNQTPASFWITNPMNTFEGNVAAGTHGTGFWFALAEEPMGLSASDPDFNGMEPYKLNMLSFRDNTAHSCSSGFDIFDRLDVNHSIIKNAGWQENSDHKMENCTWYANFLGIYTGLGSDGPTDNLIFENNAFVENRTAIMLASYSVVDQSVIVANNALQVGGERYAYRVYDGAGTVSNSHFIGWDDSKASLLQPIGASTKHPNHIFDNNTTDHSGTPRINLPVYDIIPAPAEANEPGHPRAWSHVIRDLTGGITEQPNTNIVSTHPFQLTGDETFPSNWSNAAVSPNEFCLSRLTYHANVAIQDIPKIVCTREKPGKPTAHVYYMQGFIEPQQLPFIVNGDYEYAYRFESLPSEREVNMIMDDANPGDNYIAHFVGFGTFNNVRVSGNPSGLNRENNLNALRAATSTSYYIDTSGDVWFKMFSTGAKRVVTVKWNGNPVMPVLDTDGDQQPDGLEFADLNRNPFDAADLAAEFNSPGDFEGWDMPTRITGATVSGGTYKGTASATPDAQIRNYDYDFDAAAVGRIDIRMKATVNTTVQLFWGVNGSGFSSTRRLNASYTGNGNWQVVSFDVGMHNLWNGTITELRLDPVNGFANVPFEIDYIRSVPPDPKSEKKWKPATNDLSETEVMHWPSPVRERLNLDWAAAGEFHTVQVLDLNGRILRSESIAPGLTRWHLSFRAQPLPDGVYLVLLRGATQTRRIRILKTQTSR